MARSASRGRSCATAKPPRDEEASEEGHDDDLRRIDEHIEPTDDQLAADPARHGAEGHAEDADHGDPAPPSSKSQGDEPESDAGENGEDLVHGDLLGRATFDRAEWREHSRFDPDALGV